MSAQSIAVLTLTLAATAQVTAERFVGFDGAPAAAAGPAAGVSRTDAVDGDGEKRPGLLLEWRQRDRRWEGLVVYAARIRPHGWGLVQEWIPAELLTPV